MRNLAVPGIVAGAVLFVWGFVSHVVLPWQDPVWHEFRDESLVSRVVEANAPERGVYHLPYAGEDLRPDRLRAFVNVVPPGSAPSASRQLAAGLVINIVSVFLVLGLLYRGRRRSFPQAVGFFAAVGLTIGFVSHAYYWNWFGFPTPYVLVTILDLLIGWTLAGIVVGKLAPGGRSARVGAGRGRPGAVEEETDG